MTITQAIADLLTEAGRAHHKAYAATDGDDPEWPLWYAAYLQTTLNELLGAQLTQAEIVYYLVLADKQYPATEPPQTWSDYFAEFIVRET